MLDPQYSGGRKQEKLVYLSFHGQTMSLVFQAFKMAEDSWKIKGQKKRPGQSGLWLLEVPTSAICNKSAS